MAGPRPDDNYNPTNTVAPAGGMPSDYLNVRANPNTFGAQVGGALEQTGKTLGGLGDEAMGIAIQRQGMINETLATDAETKAASTYGSILGQYKTKEGLQAVNDLPQTVAALQQVRQQIRTTLPNPAAQRSFDMLAARREGYALSDVNLYASTQIKAADTRSAQASLNQAIDSASDPTIAHSEPQFQDALSGLNFQAARVLTNQGYGADSGTGMQQAKDGSLSFDTSKPEGQQADAVYKQFIQDAQGKIWTNRIETVAFDPKQGSVTAAVNMLDANKDQIPSATYAKLSHTLAGPYRSAQTRNVADSVWGQANQDYLNSLTPTTPGGANVPQLVNTFIQQESSGGKTSTNLGQIQPGTWAQYAKPGENINNPKDNQAVTQRILTDYNQKYNGDPQRIAVAYFSGPGNVSDAGSPTPWKQDLSDSSGKSVSSYVSDIAQRLGASKQGYQSQADFLRTHYSDYVNKAEDTAQSQFGDDPAMIQQARAQTEQRLNDVIRTQELSTRANQNTVMSYVMGEKTNGNLVTSVDQLEHGPPEIAKAWHDIELNNPMTANYLQNKIATANSRGAQATYGTDFYKHLLDVTSGRVSNPGDLFGYVGPDHNAPLTNTGLSTLSKMTQDQSTPDGHAFRQAEAGFLSNIQKEYTGAGLIPGVTSTSTNTEFNKALQEIVPKIEAGRAKGLTAQQMFSPQINGKDNPDYVSSAVKPPSITSLSAPTLKMLNPQTAGGAAPSSTPNFNPNSYSSVDDVGQAYKKGLLTKTQAYALVNSKFGGFAPSVPKPE